MRKLTPVRQILEQQLSDCEKLIFVSTFQYDRLGFATDLSHGINFD